MLKPEIIFPLLSWGGLGTVSHLPPGWDIAVSSVTGRA